ncbi:hydroxysteroid dehydrogenase-like protein 2 [Agrilus planipennis]|uniref:Hydroxysteroid dehydrogenase-like protein 2 n=1 Tax=Agrilus planipennis TaxID=224129 RepID=A0A1W4WE02_AGRPL|nr:hydroxysteroid dehydrogenase-like protein 2 [Agrilus planipennis]
MNTGKLKGLTIFITGASRGIGKSIALKAAKDGANIVIAAKTATPHPKLPGTIYTACEEVEKLGGKGLACILDVRDEAQVQAAVNETVNKFGGIDILVNNASAISLTNTSDTDMKRYDLMHGVNTRGTFLVSKTCLPYLKKSPHAHILNISPPLNMQAHWFANHVAYTMAKYGMSLCVLGMHEEFRPSKIGVNALWPRTAIHTAAIEMLSGKDSANYCRKPEIMADAAYYILCQDPKTTTGNFFIDDEVLQKAGVNDFDQYCVNPEYRDKLMLDFFLDATPVSEFKEQIKEIQKKPKESNTSTSSSGQVANLFKSIENNLNPQLVEKVQAVYQFEVTGEDAGKWFIDLKSGDGKCGQGEAPDKPDATLRMDSKYFFEIFSGKQKPAMAFMTGKLKITGNLQKAMKLEKLMGSLKAKL